MFRHYSKCVINKVKCVFSSIRLREYVYVLGLSNKNGEMVPHTWPDKRKLKGVNIHVQFIEKYKEVNDKQPPDFQESGVYDGTRSVVGWSNNLGYSSTLGLQLSSHEHARRIPLQRLLKINHTIYCKPNYYHVLGTETSVPDALTIIKGTGCPQSVEANQLFLAPSKDGNRSIK